MTRDEIAARNRANAAQSTGPRTGRGKAASARNAQKHGALARPETDRITTWLQVILDEPERTSVDLSGDILHLDDRTGCAIRLAEAEARLCAAEAALRAREDGSPSQGADSADADGVGDFKVQVDALLEGLEAEGLSVAALTEAMGLLRVLEAPTAHHRRAHALRLRRRYVAEARARRRKAFAAW